MFKIICCYYRYFLEDIIFQQVADRIIRDTHNNITIAIRQAIKPYIIFKNDTDPNFASMNGKLPNGNIGYNISNTVISGFANMEQKLKKVTAKMTTNIMTIDLRMTIHNLIGKFDFKLEENKPTIGKATFSFSRIDINVSFNMLKPIECKAEVTVNQPNIKYGSKLSPDNEKTITNVFIDIVKNQLSSNICKSFSQAIKPGK